MIQNAKQYLKYKEKFKIRCIVGMIASACTLLTLIFFIFLPCFKINYVDGAEPALSFRFSICDDIALSCRNLYEMSINDLDSSVLTAFFFQILGLILFGVIAVILIIDSIVSTLHMIHLNDYALIEYAKIKSRQDQRNRGIGVEVGMATCFAIGITFEIYAIVFSKFFLSTKEAFGSVERPMSYFAYMNSVTGALVVVILFFLLSIGLFIAKSYMSKAIKTQILTEDFILSEESKPGNFFPRQS